MPAKASAITIFMGLDYRHRWVILIATLIGMVITGALGRWQLQRAAQKEAVQAALDSRRAQPPLAAAALARGAEAAQAQHHRRIVLTGRWLPERTVFLDNRPLDGQAGFIVVTPLLLGPDDAVIVQRGWVPRDARERTRLPALWTPTAPVTIEGRIAPPPSERMAFGPEAAGPIRQNLQLAAYEREIGLRLRPLSVLQLTPSDARDVLTRRWPDPAINVATHYGYAAQWFGLCATLAGLYVWFQLIRPKLGTRR